MGDLSLEPKNDGAVSVRATRGTPVALHGDATMLAERTATVTWAPTVENRSVFRSAALPMTFRACWGCEHEITWETISIE